jgi:hypothetical protein
MIHVHLRLAERGKQLALAGHHAAAVQHYLQAMKHARARGVPAVFLRHYTQCALESLELMGALDEVLATCDRARKHYASHPPEGEVAQKERVRYLEREGVVLLRLGRCVEARARLNEAIIVALPARVPLAETLVRWLRLNLRIDKERLERELVRQRYWSVRSDSVRSEGTLPLPPQE